MSLERPTALDFPPEAEGMDMVYCRPDTLTDVPFHYCRTQCSSQGINGSY